MKKNLLITMTFLLVCSFSLSAQTYIYNSTYYSSASRPQDGDWTEYSEWHEDDTSISIDLDLSEIAVYDDIWDIVDYYEIIGSEDEVTDEDGDLITEYECIDENFGNWTIKVVKRNSVDPPRTEIYVTDENQAYAYIVEKFTE
jgi:hypothetical protein